MCFFYSWRIQLPKSVSTMKKTEKAMPLLTPPWDSMPSYITMFQSSPVRIYHTNTYTTNQMRQHKHVHSLWFKICKNLKAPFSHLYKCKLLVSSFVFSSLSPTIFSFQRALHLLLTWNTVIIAAGKVSKLVGGVPFSKLNLVGQNKQKKREKEMEKRSVNVQLGWWKLQIARNMYFTSTAVVLAEEK